MAWGPHVSDPGSQTGPTESTINRVKPAGDSTPARLETVARLRKRPQGIGEAVLAGAHLVGVEAGSIVA